MSHGDTEARRFMVSFELRIPYGTGAPRGTRKPALAEAGCATVRQDPPMRQWASPRARPRLCRAQSGPPPRRTRNGLRPTRTYTKSEGRSNCDGSRSFRAGRAAAAFVMPRGFSCPTRRKARSAGHGLGGGRGTCSPGRRQRHAVNRRRRSFAEVGFRVPRRRRCYDF